MPTIELPGAGKITTFDEPPSPERHPLGRWSNRWGTAYRVIKPEFNQMKHRSGRPLVQKPASEVWSGFVACRKTQKTAINSVEAVWAVPNCYPPKKPVEGNWYTSSSWIGIDGDGKSGDTSKDILQVGVDSDVMQFGGTVTRWVSAWWEWVPGDNVWIPNFPLSPGDTLDAVIAMEKDSKTKATIYLHNRTSGAATSFQVEAPNGTKLKGNCAEWIVEKVELDGSPLELASYGAVCFDEAKAFTDTGKEIKLGPQGKFYHMKGAKNQVISRGYLRGHKLVRCAYEGPISTEIVLTKFSA